MARAKVIRALPGLGVFSATIQMILFSLLQKYLDSQTSIYAEAKAIYLGLQHVVSMGCASLWVESDSQVLINILNNVIAIPWSIMYIIRDIKLLMRNFQDLRLSHI